jgi:tetratricopeptide (TPR) repeat protein
MGVAYAAVANYGQAASEWDAAVHLRPNMLEARRALAILAMRKNDTPTLLQSSEAMIKIAPRMPEGYVFHARALFAQGNQAGAEADLKKVIEIAPQNATGYAQMGELRTAQKRPDDAAKFYAQALERDPSSAEALTGLVNVSLGRKEPAKALKIIQDQIARVPANSRFYVLLGEVELKNQNSTEAEKAFEKATEIDKNNVQAFMMLATVQASRGSVDQAIGEYQRALQANPRDSRLDVALGELFETKGQWQQAQDLYQSALQIQPDYAVAANNLAYLMLEHGGNVNVAFTLAQTARRGLPDLPNSADTLGWAYYHQGVYNAAIDLFQEAIKADAKNPTYHYHLGMSYEKANNPVMAKKELEYTLQVSPNFSQATEIRRVLAESATKAE